MAAGSAISSGNAAGGGNNFGANPSLGSETGNDALIFRAIFDWAMGI